MSHAMSGRPPLPKEFFSDSDDVDCAYLWDYLYRSMYMREQLPVPEANPDISGIGVSGMMASLTKIEDTGGSPSNPLLYRSFSASLSQVGQHWPAYYSIMLQCLPTIRTCWTQFFTMEFVGL